ncbi:uncharacterized protein LOC129331735 isoform X2 [Eublepharis macularius]|uniref:Uncharacterized protein LOC129331735 isoform X2 n=1 Tax=Eublepharis macularius TaxID=481883 RepID=A0AA97L354_EUBMA|nr:uncharacterized protein LOC129331735 isoform X2 [Eublepharis macularius]
MLSAVLVHHLQSITSSFMESRRVSLEGSEHSLSKYSEKPSVKSIKSILKSEVTSFKSVTLTEPGSSTPHRKEDGVIFVDVEKHDSALFEQVESTTDLTPMEDEHKSETASFKGVTSASIKQAEHDTSSSHRQDVEKYDSVLFEQVESTADLTLMEEEPKSETASFKGMASASIKQTEHIPHRKEDGVAFLGVEDYDSDQEQFESTTSLTPRGDLNLATSETLPFNRETLASTKQAKGISHRKEDGVAFLDLEDSDSDQQEQLESTTDLRPLEDLITSETSSFKRGPAAFVKQAKGIPHRKEDGVAFLDLEDSDSDQQEQLENTTNLWPLEDLNTSETYFKRGPAAFVEQAKSIPHRKEDGVAFLDIEDSDSDQQEHLVESTTDLRPVEHLATPETESSRSVISASVQQTEPLCSTLRRKGDDVPILPGEVCDHDQQQQYKSIHALSSVEDLAKSEMASIKSETPTSVKEAEHVPHRKKDDVSSADDENEKRSELISSTND